MFFFFDSFFKNNTENRIGFKKLTKADLGFGSSHQTHIGLMSDVCTFLGNEDVVTQAMLIFEDYCDILSCSFDRIAVPEGGFRSPKIRTGIEKKDSVVAKIREFASERPDVNWYLAWFGLESEELVFWLICEDSEDYKKAKSFFNKDRQVLTMNDSAFEEAIIYMLQRVNFVSGNVKEELEIASQIGNDRYQFKPKDLENANRRFQEIGRKGEELVNEYLEEQKAKGKIGDFEWENKNRESGAPFDFLIDNKMYVDVKATDTSFNRPIFFSGEEISFAAQIKNGRYSVFRVYDMKDEAEKLRICQECARYLKTINDSLNSFKTVVSKEETILKSVKLGVDPGYCFQNISDSILLNK